MCSCSSGSLLLIYCVQAIINFGKEHYAATHPSSNSNSPPKVPNVGRGIAMAIGLFLVTITASICQHQFFWRSMTTGLLARAALITSVYKRGVRLTGKARTTLPNSALVNHISTDVRVNYGCFNSFTPSHNNRFLALTPARNGL